MLIIHRAEPDINWVLPAFIPDEQTQIQLCLFHICLSLKPVVIFLTLDWVGLFHWFQISLHYLSFGANLLTIPAKTV